MLLTNKDISSVVSFLLKFSNNSWKSIFLDVFFRKPENPIFFYTGNEGDIESFIKASGFVGYLAAYMNALIVFAEHVCIQKIINLMKLQSFLE